MTIIDAVTKQYPERREESIIWDECPSYYGFKDACSTSKNCYECWNREVNK